MSFVLRVILNAVGFWLTTLILGSHFVVDATNGDTKETNNVTVVLVYLGVALIFAVINAILKPVIQALSLPLYILTLGLFGLVVNALVLLLISWLTDGLSWGLRVENFGWAVLAGIILAIINGILTAIVPGARRRGQY